MKILNKKNIMSPLTIWLAAIAIVSFIFVLNWSWKGLSKEGYKQIINSDGSGYYMYLPNTFINQSISNQEIDNRFILEAENGKGYNKYFVGTSIFMAPFFGLGHLVALVQGGELDGYSSPYQKAISLAGIFYLLLGLFFCAKLLQLFEFKAWLILAVLGFITFGTNLFSYAVLMPSMSHVYSFFCVSIFLFSYKKFFLTGQIKYHYIGLLFLCFIILIRPLNGILLFAIPIMAGSWGHFINQFKAVFKSRSFLISLLIGLALLIQPLFWYIQTGSFMVWSYQDEGFEFLSPHLFEVLFGFRKGWFVYTPIALICFLGVYFWMKQNRFSAYYFLGFMLVAIYLISSWWNWYYGPSFSQRPFVEFYPLMLLPFAFLLQSKVKILALSLSVSFVFLNLIQNYQYQYGIISSWDMNWKKYQYTFLKTSDKYQNCLGGNNDILPFKAKKEEVITSTNNFETSMDFWQTGEFVIQQNNSFSNYNKREYNTTFSYDFELKNPTKRGLFIEIALNKYQLEKQASKEALIIIETKGENNFNNYYSVKLDEIPSEDVNLIEHLNYNIEIPQFRGSNGELVVFVWNKEKGAFLIDDFSITINSLY